MANNESSSDFTGRMNVILSSIDSIAVNLENNEKLSGKRSASPGNPSESAQFDSDNFKIPRMNRVLKRNPNCKAPAYVQNPQKWTKYSLKDVPEINDRSNMNIALTIVEENKTRSDVLKDTEDLNEEKIIFKKPLHSKISKPLSNLKLSKESNQDKDKSQQNVKSKSSGITLNHLLYEDEDEDE